MACAQRAVRLLEGRSPSIANDERESRSRRNAAARATRSRGVRPMTSRARSSRRFATAASMAGVHRTMGQKPGVPGRLSTTLWRKERAPSRSATCRRGSTTSTERTLPASGTSSRLRVNHSYRNQMRRATAPVGVARTISLTSLGATTLKRAASTPRSSASHLRAKASWAPRPGPAA
jgi:hypothetical protein